MSEVLIKTCLFCIVALAHQNSTQQSESRQERVDDHVDAKQGDEGRGLQETSSVF